MLLGSELQTAPGWRIVEGDLHDISGRVREYDRDARLVREEETGRLGLARWVPTSSLITGGAFLLAGACIDWDTQQPLVGEPDPRVLRDMHNRDSHRIKSFRAWNRRHQEGMRRMDDERFKTMSDFNGDHAERLVHSIGRKDRGIRNFAAVPRGV